MKANKLIPLLRRGDGSTLSLDFTAMSSLDSRFTFTRASTGTYINSAGLVTTMAAASTNDPTKARFDYNPTTLAPRGLLIEGSATNSLQRSEEFNLAPWNAFSATITVNDGVAPDGNTTADSITPSVASTGTFYNSSFAAGTWTFSIWAKANPGSSFNISVDTSSNGRACTYTLTSGGSAGTPFVRGTGGTVTSFSASTQTFQNGWVRCVATVVTTGSNFVAITNPTDTNKILIWGAQLEAGSVASSYIPTGASTVQRAADVCTMSGTNFSSWFNSTEGTFLATGERAITSNFGRLLSANANNTTSAFDLGASTNGRWLITNTTSQADITAGTVTANTALKVAGAFANNDAQIAFNGTLGTADTSVSLPTVSQLDIGADRTAVYLNGRIRSIKFWPTRLPDATLQGLTQ